MLSFFDEDTRKRKRNKDNFWTLFRSWRSKLILLASLTIFLFVNIHLFNSTCDTQVNSIRVERVVELDEALVKIRKCTEQQSELLQRINKLQWNNENIQVLNEELKREKKELQREKESLERQVAALLGNEKNSVITPESKPHDEILVPEAPVMQIDSETIWGVPNAVTRESAPLGLPTVIFTYNRPQALRRTLNNIFKYLPPTGHPIFISQDGSDPKVEEVIQSFKDRVYFLRFYYDQTSQKREPGFESKQWTVYHKISAHYRFVLEKMLDELKYENIIILEDDMEISPDFFSYFTETSKLLQEDESIFTISAWNDNGQRQFVKDSGSLYRTDVFPGLGWMMTSKLWSELTWPLAFWDEYLRTPEVRRGRSCIFPEINRVKTFGKQGSSKGQFYDKYLDPIKLNSENIDWSTVDISYLIKENYHNHITSLIDSARTITKTELLAIQKESSGNSDTEYNVEYTDIDEFTAIGKKIGLMIDHKESMPRTSYNGLVICRVREQRVFFLPNGFELK